MILKDFRPNLVNLLMKEKETLEHRNYIDRKSRETSLQQNSKMRKSYRKKQI